MGAVVPADDLPGGLQSNVVPDSDLPDHLVSARTTQAEDPDVKQFRKMQGRNPTQDELASIKAGNAGNIFGAVGNAFIGKPIQAAVAGGRGILDLATGKGVNQAAQDVEETNSSPEMTDTSARLGNAVLGSKFNPMNWADVAGQKAGDWTMEHSGSPGLATAARMLPDVAMSALGFRHGMAEGSPSPMAEPETTVGASSKYAPAVAAERARLADIHSRGLQAGLDLPESGTEARYASASANNTQVSNSVIRQHFGLPDDPEGAAPLTPEMMESVRGQVAQETYGPVRAQKSIGLSAAATDAIDTLPSVIRSKLKLQGRPLSDATPEEVGGGDFVNMSQRLRAVAKNYDKVFNRTGNPEAGALADLTHEAVDAWEQSGRDSMPPEIADAWEKGRTTIAQTHDVEAALDGAGNVNVAALRKRPYLTGDLDMLANLGGRYPEAFKVTRVSAPRPSLPARAAAATAKTLLPLGGAALGSTFGPAGAAGGAAIGRLGGEKIAEKIAPQ